MPNVKAWLEKSTKTLAAAEINTARLDCLVLLEDATGQDRGWLLAHPEANIKKLLEQSPSLSDKEKLDTEIRRRAEHEPLAYIRCKTEFYGREFYIDHRVLEPRPESETMIELLRLQKLPKELTIVDLGTGSGALAITAKLEFPTAKVIGTDIDANCLVVAKQNAKKFNVDIEFVKGNLLEPLAECKLTAILANLPYVPDHFQINPAAMAEPRIAIFGGPDGLDLYRKFFIQLKKLDSKPLFIFTECMPPQHEGLIEIARQNGFKLMQTNDFIQVFSP